MVAAYVCTMVFDPVPELLEEPLLELDPLVDPEEEDPDVLPELEFVVLLPTTIRDPVYSVVPAEFAHDIV